MFYILYMIDCDGRGYFMRKFVNRQRELKDVTSYWMIPQGAN